MLFSVGKNPTANVLPSSDQGDKFTQKELSRFTRGSKGKMLLYVYISFNAVFQ